MDDEMIIDIENAMRLIKNSYSGNVGFTKHSLLYPFSTENLAGYYNKIDFKNKKVLTVASSGDHAFNAILYGASEVSTFDINRFTKYYLNLKKAAISILNYRMFIDFFDSNSYPTFDISIYKIIRDLLTEDSKKFWDALFSKFSGSNIKRGLFRPEFCPATPMREINPYTYEHQYYELQNKIGMFDVKFVESNITDLNNNIKKNRYDLILLSNISDYINRVYNIDCLEKYKKLILNLSNNINENGMLVLAYIYASSDEENNNLFYCKEDRERIFNEKEFTTTYFEGVRLPWRKDAVMIYTKK